MDHVNCFLLGFGHHRTGQRRVVVRFVQKRFVITDEQLLVFTAAISPLVSVL